MDLTLGRPSQVIGRIRSTHRPVLIARQIHSAREALVPRRRHIIYGSVGRRARSNTSFAPRRWTADTEPPQMAGRPSSPHVPRRSPLSRIAGFLCLKEPRTGRLCEQSRLRSFPFLLRALPGRGLDSASTASIEAWMNPPRYVLGDTTESDFRNLIRATSATSWLAQRHADRSRAWAVCLVSCYCWDELGTVGRS